MRGLLCLAAIIMIGVSGGAVLAQTDMKPPVAKKDPKVLKIHGYEVTDNYAWLRDREEKKNPEIIKYLEDENAYTEAHMGPHKAFADTTTSSPTKPWSSPTPRSIKTACWS